MASGHEDGYWVRETERIDDEREDALEVVDDINDQSDYDGGQFDLEARLSLTRVPGMSTDLSDISEVEYRQLRLERVVLCSVWTQGTATDAENAMAELKALAETAGSQVLEAVMQRRTTPDPATYIGSGKVAELAEVVRATGADTVICDGELDAAQLRNLEDRVKVKVVDRTALILDIFAQHARSVEGRTQVELAQLNYLKQRLRGWGGNLSRQTGGRTAGGAGIGGRGPGETRIETDRRRISHRIAVLRRRLKRIETTRASKRVDRIRNKVPSVAIVGYTNAGKSSLLNRLTRAGVLVENALFATLDPTTRRTTTSDGRVYTLTDTVGFVRHLPHDLVEAFASTLEETATADVLVHVVDAADPDPIGQVDAVRGVLSGIGASDIPEILVLDKIDRLDDDVILTLRSTFPGAYLVSAHTGEGIDELVEAIEAGLPIPSRRVDVVVPYARGDLMDKIHRNGTIELVDHTTDGTHVIAHLHPALAAAVEEACDGD
ncbi:GTPase HflX [Cutibacterium namnetense]|uniref:GTPase HflX n=1 Tax=Cutibacterium namnetense TaxID=1574624 RepID=UPI0005B48C01|nr:GTPase HflX [Cutibacterium namnetense]TKW72031.1 MAG: GTPase HflX [Cutibacterium acnes]